MRAWTSVALLLLMLAGSVRSDDPKDPLPEGVLFRLGTTRFRAGSLPHATALSPNGAVIAVTSEAGIAFLDRVSGRHIGKVPWTECVPQFMSRISFSPDGKLLAQAPYDGGLKIWAVPSGKLVQHFLEIDPTNPTAMQPGGRIQWIGLHFSPNGKELYADNLREMTVLNVADGKILRRFPISDMTRAVAGELFVTIKHQPSRHCVYDTAGTLRLEVKLDGNPSYAAFGPGQKTLLSVTREALICVLDLPSGKAKFRVQVPVPAPPSEHFVTAVAQSPDGGTLVAGTGTGEILRWDIAAGKELPSFRGHTQAVTSLLFTPDGKALVSSGSDQLIHVWDWPSGRLTSNVGGYSGKLSVASSPTGIVALGDRTGRVEWWRPARSQCTVLQEKGSPIYATALSADGTRLAAGNADSKVNLWDIPEGKKRPDIVLPKPAASGWRSDEASLTFSPDGRSFIASFRQIGTRCWDAKTLHQRWENSYSGPAVLSPDGERLALVGWGVRNWEFLDATTGRTMRTFVERSPGPISYSPNGRVLAVGDWDGFVTVQKIDTRQILAELTGFTTLSPIGKRRIGAVAWSLLGEWVLAGADSEVRLWEIATGQELMCFRGHRGPIYAAAFAGDGRSVISAAGDLTVLGWSLRPPGAAIRRKGRRNCGPTWRLATRKSRTGRPGRCSTSRQPRWRCFARNSPTRDGPLPAPMRSSGLSQG